MEITPLKQNYYNSCLVTSLLMISKMTDQSIEERIFFESQKRRSDNSLLAVLESFVDNTMLSTEVIVDNQTFANSLIKAQNRKNKRIKIRQEKINLKLIKKMLSDEPLVVQIDNNLLGDISHVSKFVVIEKMLESGKFQLIDPATGGSKFLSQEKLEEAISSLKSHIKICPVIIRKI